ncbi:glycosyltransferase family 8 protein [Thiorhodococcus minor]|uniref:Glycosyltransferase family 8 protein n=1 Tax=Thiorhodococcus minor TaxID=57489 RepID=A0A6M0K5G2_9GAMM|nr:glycosyltransferase family 8 protein [Thiorhodococcus minor]NEV65002.1 glycosyltransferase family 8 protein [Thiorhodococcus minor]
MRVLESNVFVVFRENPVHTDSVINCLREIYSKNQDCYVLLVSESVNFELSKDLGCGIVKAQALAKRLNLSEFSIRYIFESLCSNFHLQKIMLSLLNAKSISIVFLFQGNNREEIKLPQYAFFGEKKCVKASDNFEKFVVREPIFDSGILYCCFGEHFISQAIYSATSVKKYNPSIPIAIYTNRTDIAMEKQCFDIIIEGYHKESLERIFLNPKRMHSSKIISLTSTPFDKTLYIDTDSVCNGDLSEIFLLLRHFDFVFTNEDISEREYDENLKRTAPVRLISIQGRGLNAGVFGYSLSNNSKQFIEEWIKSFLIKAQKDPDSGSWQGVNDQAALNESKKTDITYATIPNYYYNATPRIWRELHAIGMLDRVKIFHAHWMHKYKWDGNNIYELLNYPEVTLTT